METRQFSTFDAWKEGLIEEISTLVGEAPINDNPVKFGDISVNFKALDPQSPATIEVDVHNAAESPEPKLIAKQRLEWPETDVKGLAHKIVNRVNRRAAEVTP